MPGRSWERRRRVDAMVIAILVLIAIALVIAAIVLATKLNNRNKKIDSQSTVVKLDNDSIVRLNSFIAEQKKIRGRDSVEIVHLENQVLEAVNTASRRDTRCAVSTGNRSTVCIKVGK